MSSWRPAHSAALLEHPLLALNFHDVPADDRALVRRRLRAVADLGAALSLDDLDRGGGVGPRVFVAFYDGFRDAGLFGAEVCHDLGLRAYFFPVFSVEDPAITLLTDDDLAELAQVHEVGFHTGSHVSARMVDPGNLAREVTEPWRRLTAAAGRPPRLGVWWGGARFDPSQLGNVEVARLGLRYLVSNWSIEPVPVP